jgi:hypothetical protein
MLSERFLPAETRADISFPQNGTILVYPEQTQVHISDPNRKLRVYMMGRKLQEHKFCSTCGVSVYIGKLPLPAAVAAEWSAEDKEMWPKLLPLNLKCMDGIELDRILVNRSDMALELEPKYSVL